MELVIFRRRFQLFFCTINLCAPDLNSPLGSRYRERVWRVIPSSLQRSAILVSDFSIATWAICSFIGVILNFLPPFLPRALAEANPALVLSEISSLSYSANEAKILKINLPLAVLVSISAPCPVSTLKPMPLFCRSWTILIK